MKKKSATPWWLILFVIWLAMIALWPVDSTDRGRWSRSGLRLHVDAATGCHYVSTMFGGPTPRLDANGGQICIGEETP